MGGWKGQRRHPARDVFAAIFGLRAIASPPRGQATALNGCRCTAEFRATALQCPGAPGWARRGAGHTPRAAWRSQRPPSRRCSAAHPSLLLLGGCHRNLLTPGMIIQLGQGVHSVCVPAQRTGGVQAGAPRQQGGLAHQQVLTASRRSRPNATPVGHLELIIGRGCGWAAAC